MAEKKRIPRWLKIIVGFLLCSAGVWLWLDHAFRAPDVVPLLLQSNTATAAEQPLGDETNAAAAVAPPTTETAIERDESVIDCSTPSLARDQLQSFVEQSFGAELTELVLSGALTWGEKHPSTIRQDTEIPAGVVVPAGYQAYTDTMLKLAADNGDAMAAAIVGARTVQSMGIGYQTPEAEFRARLAEAERYLWQGVQGQVDGTLMFLSLAAQNRVVDANMATGKAGKPASASDDQIEFRARTLAMQVYGDFEERIVAHTQLYLLFEAELSALTDQERQRIQDRAEQLLPLYSRLKKTRTAEERRAENAVVSLLKKGASKKTALKTLRCHDGRKLDEVLPEGTKDDIARSYGLPL